MTIVETVAARKTAWKVEELAELLNCSTGKIYKAIKSGRLPVINVGGMKRLDPLKWLRGLDIRICEIQSVKVDGVQHVPCDAAHS